MLLPDSVGSGNRPSSSVRAAAVTGTWLFGMGCRVVGLRIGVVMEDRSPLRHAAGGTVLLMTDCTRYRSPSYPPKKNVLFLITGPPRVNEKSFEILSGAPIRLAKKSRASNAPFW